MLLGTAASAPAEVTETAVYRVRFISTWSAGSHPADFPARPHFSGLIGGVHNGDVSFWSPNGIASPGIEEMAERGRKSPLDEQVQAAIDAGTARKVISGGGIALSPGLATATFTVSRDFPLVTLVSMVAPSPDWFVGVHELDLRSRTDWLEEKVVTLYAWDAGTDGGRTFESPNRDTSPQTPISLIDSGPLANGVPLGTFTFIRQDDPEPDVLRLRGDRFHVSAEWQNLDFDRGRARAVKLHDDSGYLWFFAEGNLEVVVKILDGCSFNDRYWVFAGGLTNTGVELTVEDTETGQVNIYFNELGEVFQPIQDVDAFATCP